MVAGRVSEQAFCLVLSEDGASLVVKAKSQLWSRMREKIIMTSANVMDMVILLQTHGSWRSVDMPLQ